MVWESPLPSVPMNWQMGLQRLRLVATAALAVGVVLCASVLGTRGLGYAPDTAVAPLFSAMWPMGLALILVGALLWVAVWVLRGFLPSSAAGAGISRAEPRSGHLEP